MSEIDTLGVRKSWKCNESTKNYTRKSNKCSKKICSGGALFGAVFEKVICSWKNDKILKKVIFLVTSSFLLYEFMRLVTSLTVHWALWFFQ